jgi:response regulator RpfG family c-di-GMP phosphodiesterase
MVGGIAFDIKINKDNKYIANLEKECSLNNEFQEDFTSPEINLQDFDLDIHKKNIDEHIKSKNILIVDDDPQTLVSLFLSLKSNDLKPKVVIAKTAEAALEKFQEQDFALVISDYRLPGMDGINFLSYVKEKYPKTARVLITAFPNSVLKEEAKTKASVDLFVEKPWVTDSIKKLLQEIVETNI